LDNCVLIEIKKRFIKEMNFSFNLKIGGFKNESTPINY